MPWEMYVRIISTNAQLPAILTPRIEQFRLLEHFDPLLQRFLRALVAALGRDHSHTLGLRTRVVLS